MAAEAPAPTSWPAPRPSSRLLSAGRSFGPALVAFVVIIALWYLFIAIDHTPSYILPLPHDVVLVFFQGLLQPVDDLSAYPYHLILTTEAAAIGFVVGSVGGLFLAIVMSEVQILERALTPWVMAFQAVPKLALAPLLLIYLGYDGMTPKVAMVTIVVFFPLFVNAVAGLKGTDPDQANLMLLYRASRWQMLRLVRLPFALPLIFAGLEIGVVSAVVATTVSEFIGGRTGLGVLMLQRQLVGDIAGVFAIFILMSALGIIGYLLVVAAERRWLFWARRFESAERGHVGAP
jgi:NitT/TauT family transport system permease protein